MSDEKGTLAESLQVPNLSGQGGRNSNPSAGHLGRGSSRRSRYDSHQEALLGKVDNQHQVHFKGDEDSHVISMSDLLPSGPKMAPTSQTKSQPSKNGPPLATVQTSVHGSPYQDDPYVAHSPLVAAIFILLLALTFLVNLHQTISLTYKYENFVPKIIAVYTHKEFVLFNMLVIVGFVGLLLASSTILWTFAGFTFGLFFALVSMESSAINLANMVALGSLAAHLGASYRPQLYVTDVLLPVPV